MRMEESPQARGWLAEVSAGGHGAGEVRLLARTDVQRCLSSIDVVDVIRDTLALHECGRCVLPKEGYLPWRNSEGSYSRSIAMLGAVLPEAGVPSYGLKVINASVSNPAHGLERAGGVGICMDPETARITTIMEVGLLSALRTAAVTAVGVEVTGHSAAESLAIIGCGMQGRTHLLMLLERLPNVGRVALYDDDPDRAHALAAVVSGSAPRTVVNVGSSIQRTLRGADIVVTATTADAGYLDGTWIDSGALVAHVSLADLTDEAILGAGALYVDDVDLIADNPRRPLGRLLAEGRIDRPDIESGSGRRIDATLGGLIMGRYQPVRVTEGYGVLNPFGMGVLDVALLDSVRRQAEASDIGVSMSFG